jgi:polyisoprenoid-binding protein YceI
MLIAASVAWNTRSADARAAHPESVRSAPVSTVERSVPLRLMVAPTGNEARYRVREQLAGFDFPNDAVGATSAISGTIVVDAQGSLVRDESKIVVELTPLTSDESRRDNYLRRRTLETEAHPTVTLVPTAVHGLTLASAPAGERTFHLLADLTVKGVTRPTTWSVTAQFGADRVTGTASTAFTFEEFGITKPSLARVISVADTIRLEYDFTLIQQGTTSR